MTDPTYLQVWGNTYTRVWRTEWNLRSELLNLMNDGGVAWYNRPKPPKDHQCQQVTSIIFREGGRAITVVQRCPCGAFRANYPSLIWRNRNSR